MKELLKRNIKILELSLKNQKEANYNKFKKIQKRKQARKWVTAKKQIYAWKLINLELRYKNYKNR